MLNIIKSIFFFRMGRTASKGAARAIGLGRFATILGLIGGYRYMRRHAR